MIAVGGLFYNAEPFLDKWFECLLKQDYPKSEIRLVLVYGAGKDETPQRLRDIVRHLSRPWRRPFAEIQLFEINRILDGGQISDDEWDRYRLNQENVCKVYNHLTELSRPDDLVIMEQDVEAPPDAVRRLTEMRDKLHGDITAGVTLVTGGEMRQHLWGGGYLKVTGLPFVSACVYQPGGRRLQGISLQCNRVNSVRVPAALVNKVLVADGIATGLCLLTRRVMDAVQFETSNESSQDFYFCRRARDLGFRIVVDTGLWYEHRHYTYRVEYTEDGLYVTLIDSVKQDGIRFERELEPTPPSHLK